jgi:hypothetical protein
VLAVFTGLIADAQQFVHMLSVVGMVLHCASGLHTRTGFALSVVVARVATVSMVRIEQSLVLH